MNTHTLIGAWTAADLRRAAKYACYRMRHEVFENQVRESSLYECALSAVGLAVTENPDLEFLDGVTAATDELRRLVHAARQLHGVDETGAVRPRFAAYWLDMDERRAHMDGPEVCVLPMALRSVLGSLSDADLRVLWTIAFTGSLVDAAEQLGVTTGYMSRLAREARGRALELLYYPEAPPSLERLPIARRRNKEACTNGHSLTGDNVVYERKGRTRIARCATCRGRNHDVQAVAA